MGIQLPAVEEAIIRMTNVLEKIYSSTGTALLSSCGLLQSLNSVVLAFDGGGFCSPDVPEFATHCGAVMLMLVQCHAVAACTGLSSWGC